MNEFLAEGSGILTWIVNGYQLWRREGLTKPQSIEDATNEYRKSEDMLQQFIDDMCEVKEDYQISKPTLLKAYAEYLQQNGDTTVITSNKLTRALSHKQIKVGGDGNMYYLWIALKAQTTKEYPDEYPPFASFEIPVGSDNIEAPLFEGLFKNLNSTKK